jgi:hypothetical protein
MRKISKESVEAFMSAEKFNKGNTQVEVLANVSVLKLHNNPIAYKYNDPQGTISIQTCGWFSNTTKERLNAIPKVRIKQKDGVWYLNDEQWNGELIDLK